MSRSIGFEEFPFLIHRYAGIGVVGWIAQNDQNRGVLLDLLGSVSLLLKLREGEWFLDRRFPAGKRVGEENACPFGAVFRQRRVKVLHCQPNLQMGHNEGRGHDFESKNPFSGGLFHLCPGERAGACPSRLAAMRRRTSAR